MRFQFYICATIQSDETDIDIKAAHAAFIFSYRSINHFKGLYFIR